MLAVFGQYLLSLRLFLLVYVVMWVARFPKTHHTKCSEILHAHTALLHSVCSSWILVGRVPYLVGGWGVIRCSIDNMHLPRLAGRAYLGVGWVRLYNTVSTHTLVRLYYIDTLLHQDRGGALLQDMGGQLSKAIIINLNCVSPFTEYSSASPLFSFLTPCSACWCGYHTLIV